MIELNSRKHMSAARMKRLISAASLIASIVLAIIGVAVAHTSWLTYSMYTRVRQKAVFVEDLQRVELLITTAESAQRGYILTDHREFLQHLNDSLEPIPHILVQLANDDPDDPLDRADIEKLAEVLADKMGYLRESILTMAADHKAAREMVKRGVGRMLMENIRDIDTRMLRRKKESLEESVHRLRVLLVRLTWFVIALVGGSIVAILAGSRYARRDLALRFKSEVDLAQAMQSLEQKNAEIQLLGAFSDTLQLCFTKQEAFGAMERHIRAVFPDGGGFVGMFCNSRNRLDIVGSWGAGALMESYEPVDCNALRTGRTYCRSKASMQFSCRHSENSDTNSVCLPLTAQGETLGAMHLSLSDEEFKSAEKLNLVTKITQRAALALANLRLQEKLTNQSTRDALTGLFNRRYMEEALEREIHRAKRSASKLGVMMLDLDHFKRFNDNYGHDAGDRVIQEVAGTLRSYFRREDICCRFGGEELIVLLPNASSKDLAKRAAGLLEQIRNIRAQHLGQFLPQITASIGTAIYPDDAVSLSELVSAADRGLYRAKANGRNCYASASSAGILGKKDHSNSSATVFPDLETSASACQIDGRGSQPAVVGEI